VSDDRFEQLGIPRRKFLKASAAAAFAAPVVVSFGLDGVAEAHGDHGHRHSMGNQSCPNMTFPNQIIAAEDDLVALIGALVMGVQNHDIRFGLANSLSEKALHAALQLADGHDRGACAKIDSLISQLERHFGTSSSLTALAVSASSQAGCGCFPTHHG
jgi:hypothetical protein